jgi:hypothetical protein
MLDKSCSVGWMRMDAMKYIIERCRKREVGNITACYSPQVDEFRIYELFM